MVLVLALLVFVLKSWSWLFSRPINNLLACVRRKIIIFFVQVNEDCNFLCSLIVFWDQDYTDGIDKSN